MTRSVTSRRAFNPLVEGSNPSRLTTIGEGMGRTKAALGSLAFLVLAPGVVAGLIPWLITHWARCRLATALAPSAGPASS